MLEVENVSLSYGGVRAVDDVSLSVGQGRIVGLIGTNGAGKTSLFNVISGFTRATAGRISFLGERIDALPPSAIAGKGLLRTFQTPLGFPRMTVVENMLVFAPEHAAARRSLWARGRISGATVARALGILREFGLAARADDWVQDLSAPELKMLEFARATMAAPRLMMLDEPAAGVNPALMESLAAQIRGLRDRGVTFLVVDHNLKFISAVCEEVFAMADGRVIAHGSCADVIANPEVVRLYIGSGEEGRRPAQRAAS